MRDGVKSPCIKVCKYDEDRICIGCYRTMDDITGWLFLSEEQKVKALKEAEVRKKTPKPGIQNYDHYV